MAGESVKVYFLGQQGRFPAAGGAGTAPALEDDQGIVLEFWKLRIRGFGI